ncbi:MAG: hypothetical protein LQ337_003077 [Flavoplaca oasis]|nr:MAG: hypothetical protein LQ337_003077 [Flavoplaca oasis]
MVSSQTTIFSLPREIRDAIYDFVLNSPRTPPSCPQQAGVRYEEAIEIEDPVHELASVLYPSPNSHHGCASALLQVSRQLRQESHDFITNPHLTSSVTYKLDAMHQGPRLWLSWTTVPHSMSKIENLEIDLRILDPLDARSFLRDAPRPQTVVTLLYRTINRLLNHGPSFRYQDDTHGLKVDTLTIHLLHRYDKLLRPTKHSMKTRESPKLGDVRTSERDHQGLHFCLSSRLSRLVWLGFLSGKVQNLKISSRGGTDVYSTRNVENLNWLPDELARYGLKWGFDKEMRVKKVDSADLYPGKDEEPNGNNGREGEAAAGEIIASLGEARSKGAGDSSELRANAFSWNMPNSTTPVKMGYGYGHFSRFNALWGSIRAKDFRRRQKPP